MTNDSCLPFAVIIFSESLHFNERNRTYSDSRAYSELLARISLLLCQRHYIFRTVRAMNLFASKDNEETKSNCVVKDKLNFFITRFEIYKLNVKT